MKPNAAVHRKEEDRKKRRAAEWVRRRTEELRRRRLQAESRRRRKWLLLLLLWALESRPVQMFFLSPGPAPRPAPAKGLPRKSEKKITTVDMRSDDERRYLFDYAPRHGEESQEVYDGLTYADIVAYNRIHRPHLFPKLTPIPGTPARYANEPLHIWTLLDHLQYDFLRPDAISAIKLLVDPSSHEWIDACETRVQGSSWKDLRHCRSRTPEMTIRAFPRAAVRWREERLREAEEKKRTAEETPDKPHPRQ